MAATPPNPGLPSDEHAAAHREAAIGGFASRGSIPAAGQAGTTRVVAWDAGNVLELEGASALSRLPDLVRNPDAYVWVDLTSPTPKQAEEIVGAFALHPLILESVLEGDQRAKVETIEDVLHIVLFHLAYSERVIAAEVDLVLGVDYLLTVHDGSYDARSGNHLSTGIGPILKHGPDHLLWAICDDLVDSYFPFADRLGDAIDDLQDEVIRQTSPVAIERLFELKRELIQTRRAISPVREVFNQLTNRDESLIDDEEIVYFRDIYDHVIRLTDELDNYRELTAATLDIYLTQVNNNLSIVVKRLTGVTVILAGIGAIAGLFGMSEATNVVGGGQAVGFWGITAFILLLAAGAAVVLRRIGWI
jgi:magnesium transporter